MTATTPLHGLGISFRNLSTNIRAEGITAHYGGPSPWGRGVNRSNPTAFRTSADHNRCATIARAWHSYHLSKGWAGFAYTAAVCPHGHRFEGRGPGKRTGANGTNSGNLRSYAVVYIAGQGDPLTDAAKVAFLDEAERLRVPLRWVHSDWKPTECPGDPIRAWKAKGFSRPSGAPVPGTGAPGPKIPKLPPIRQKIPGTYREGDTGVGVWLLQGMVNATRGYSGAGEIAEDGFFGPKTAEALEKFEHFARGMELYNGNECVTVTENGIAGRHELEALRFWTDAAHSKK